MNRLFLGLFVCALALITSCSRPPLAHPLDLPHAALMEATKKASKDSFVDTATAEWLPQKWWTIFKDEQLNDFILTTFNRNPTLQTATANIYLAKEIADRARSTLFPNINWNGDVSRQKFSETGIIPFNSNPQPINTAPIAATGGLSGIPLYFTQTETELFLTYDFDIWGKNRNTWAAAIGEMKSRIADQAFIQLQLGIAVAQVYYQIQIGYRRQEVARALVNNEIKYEQLVEQRLINNLDTHQLLYTATSNLSSARELLLQIQGNLAVNDYQLKAFLAGDFLENITPIKIEEQPLPKIPLPLDVPLHLLAHRPDITAQLWLIESAGKQIEVAKAGFYPDFNIAALFGYQTIQLRKLFEWKSSMFNVDPAFSLPIFTGGRLDANLHLSETYYDLAILKYNQLVLESTKEVLDGIVVLRNNDQQLQEYARRQIKQKGIYDLTQLTLAHNLSSELDYLIAEQNMLAATDQELVSLGNTIQAMLSLIKALGGGYESCN